MASHHFEGSRKAEEDGDDEGEHHKYKQNVMRAPSAEYIHTLTSKNLPVEWAKDISTACLYLQKFVYADYLKASSKWFSI
jgi:hypothetical protein